MSALAEQTPMVWPDAAPVSLRTVDQAQRYAAQGFPTMADGDVLAVMRGDLARIADVEHGWKVAR